MSMLAFIELIHCFFIKRTVKVNAVGPSAIRFISLGGIKQVDKKIRGCCLQ